MARASRVYPTDRHTHRQDEQQQIHATHTLPLTHMKDVQGADRSSSSARSCPKKKRTELNLEYVASLHAAEVAILRKDVLPSLFSLSFFLLPSSLFSLLHSPLSITPLAPSNLIIPTMSASAEKRKPVRIWVDGCFDLMHFGTLVHPCLFFVISSARLFFVLLPVCPSLSMET